MIGIFYAIIMKLFKYKIGEIEIEEIHWVFIKEYPYLKTIIENKKYYIIQQCFLSYKIIINPFFSLKNNYFHNKENLYRDYKEIQNICDFLNKKLFYKNNKL